MTKTWQEVPGVTIEKSLRLHLEDQVEAIHDLRKDDMDEEVKRIIPELLQTAATLGYQMQKDSPWRLRESVNQYITELADDIPGCESWDEVVPILHTVLRLQMLMGALPQ